MATTDRVRWIDSMPIGHEIGKAATKESIADAINSYLNTFEYSWEFLLGDGKARVWVVIIASDNAAWPAVVYGELHRVKWKATLRESESRIGNLDGERRYVWELKYRVVREGVEDDGISRHT